MKELIKKCLILFSLPLIVWYAYVIPFDLSYQTEGYIVWKHQKSILSDPSQNYDLIILGDSAAKNSIIPNRIQNYNAANLALGGSSMVEMYYTLDTYLRNHERPEQIVILLSEKNYMQHNDFGKLTLHYHYLTPAQLLELTDLYYCGDLPGSDIPHSNDSNWNMFLTPNMILSNYLYSPVNYLPEIYRSYVFGRTTANEEVIREMDINNGWDCLGYNTSYSKESYLTVLDHFDTDPILNHYLDLTLSLCRHNDIRVLIVQNPVNEITADNLQSGFLSEIDSYFSDLKTRYPEATIISDIPCYENDMFYDELHVNGSGAEKYTEYVNSILEQEI